MVQHSRSNLSCRQTRVSVLELLRETKVIQEYNSTRDLMACINNSHKVAQSHGCGQWLRNVYSGVPFPPMSAPPSPHHSQRVQSVGGMRTFILRKGGEFIYFFAARNAQPLGGIPLQMLAPQSPSPHANTSNDIQFLGGQWNPGAPMMIPNGEIYILHQKY